MKTCTKCKVPKDLSAFSLRSRSKGTYQALCKECVRLYDSASYLTDKRKVSVRKAAKNSVDRLRKHVLSLKERGQCTKCGDKRPYVLDYHHLRDKKFSIGEGIKLGLSVKKFQLEIDKCILLCANCHRELHYLNSGVYPLPDTQ